MCTLNLIAVCKETVLRSVLYTRGNCELEENKNGSRDLALALQP